MADLCPPTAKMVDLDPCLAKEEVQDRACHPYNARGSMSEVQSLSSFQSESCDDNGMFPGGSGSAQGAASR